MPKSKLKLTQAQVERLAKAELCVQVARLELAIEAQTVENKAVKLMRLPEAELRERLKKYRRRLRRQGSSLV